MGCPVLTTQGTSDVLSRSRPAWLAVLVPGARSCLLPFAGHSGTADVPRRVIRLVEEAVDAAGNR